MFFKKWLACWVSDEFSQLSQLSQRSCAFKIFSRSHLIKEIIATNRNQPQLLCFSKNGLLVGSQTNFRNFRNFRNAPVLLKFFPGYFHKINSLMNPYTSSLSRENFVSSINFNTTSLNAFHWASPSEVPSAL